MLLNKLVLIAVTALAAPAVGQDERVRDELTARYAAMKTAMAHKDETAIRSMLARGFMSVDVSGKSEEAATMIQEVLALPADPTRQSHTTILTVTADGSNAVVKQRYDMTKRLKAADGSEKSLALSTLSTDRWVLENGAWRLSNTITNQLDYSVNGVVVLHKVNPTSD